MWRMKKTAKGKAEQLVDNMDKNDMVKILKQWPEFWE